MSFNMHYNKSGELKFTPLKNTRTVNVQNMHVISIKIPY